MQNVPWFKVRVKFAFLNEQYQKTNDPPICICKFMLFFFGHVIDALELPYDE